MSEEEVWKPIKGYEGCYEVSSFGRVKSLARHVRRGAGSFYLWKERFLSICFTGNDLQVNLGRKGTGVTNPFRVKTLVAKAFLPNPSGCRYIVNIDGNKRNCRANNLVWRRVATVADVSGKRKSIPRKIYFPMSDIRSAVAEKIITYASEKEIPPERVWDSLRRCKWSKMGLEIV